MILLTAPGTEPVTLAEAKLAARISGTQFDGLIPGLITSARQVAEQLTGQRFIQQVWREELADWPAANDVLPLYRPSAVAVSYWNGSAWVNLSGSAFAFAPAGVGFSVAPALGATWPTLGTVALGPRVRVDATAGVADAAAVDACVKTFIKALVALWVANPEAAQRQTLEPAPFLQHLLDPVRTYL